MIKEEYWTVMNRKNLRMYQTPYIYMWMINGTGHR